MKIDDLIVTQETLTEVKQLQEMVDFVKANGFFTKEEIASYNANNEGSVKRGSFKGVSEHPKLISITEFEDGSRFVHDGHHRLSSIHIGGRDFLREDEFNVYKMCYQDYDTINFDKKFVTPFVPSHEIRLADFSDFKNIAVKLIKENKINEAIYFIRNNKGMYCKKRSIFKIGELVKGM